MENETQEILTAQQKLDKKYSVKSAPITVKDVDTSSRIVTGLFNAYNYIDSDRDVLLMGSAAKSISERGPKSQAVAKIKHALNHDLSLLPGKILTLEERSVEVNGKTVQGIYFETKMATSTLGNDTLIGYHEGIYDNHSIGFRYVNMEMIERESDAWSKYAPMVINAAELVGKDIFWVVKEIALYEGSTVAFGANSLTPYLGAKSADGMRLKIAERVAKLRKQLSSGTMSDEAMKNFEIEMLQLEQIIIDFEPQTKSTTANGRIEESTQEEGKSTPEQSNNDAKKSLLINLLTNQK